MYIKPRKEFNNKFLKLFKSVKMDPTLFFYLSSSDESEKSERIIRKQLRDKSNPLALSNKGFIKRFRLSKEAFQYVLSSLNFPSQMSTAVPPVLQLAATLSLLGSGGYQHSVGSDYLIGMCQSTVSKFTSNLLIKMENELCRNHIKFRTENSACKEWFMQKHKIPGVIGCIDGTHFGLQKPKDNEHMYYNRKGFHSLNAMIICDHKNRICAINSKFGGSAHDSFVWKHSNERMFFENQFYSNRNQNSWLLGDSGYPLEPWCITPYRNPPEGSSESAFNDVHSKARCVVERTIGILKGRWKILIYDKRGRYHPEKVAMHANVCSALHNICIKFKVPFHPSSVRDVHETFVCEIGDEARITRIAQNIRNQIKHSVLN